MGRSQATLLHLFEQNYKHRVGFSPIFTVHNYSLRNEEVDIFSTIDIGSVENIFSSFNFNIHLKMFLCKGKISDVPMK